MAPTVLLRHKALPGEPVSHNASSTSDVHKPLQWYFVPRTISTDIITWVASMRLQLFVPSQLTILFKLK